MDKREFIEKLQRTLAGGLNSSLVADHVRYYQDYIDSEIRKGKSEKEVLESLGDPRLLAKSIIEANKHTGESYGSNREYDEEVSDYSKRRERNTEKIFEHIVALPGWLIMLIVTVLVIIVIGIATRLLFIFAPVILIGLSVLLIIKVFQNRPQG